MPGHAETGIIARRTTPEPSGRRMDGLRNRSREPGGDAFSTGLDGLVIRK